MTPLKVTAHLERGFSAADAWSPSLDSILAYFLTKKRMGNESFRNTMAIGETTTPDDLPLLKTQHDNLWWWACSVPTHEALKVIDRRFFKRFNIDKISSIEDKVKRVELTKSVYKNYALSFKHIITDKIEWSVIGDKKEIEVLLKDCLYVGSNRNKGMGYIKRWDVVEDKTARDKALFERFLPKNYADENKISGLMMWRGFRPCFRDENNQGLCILGITND